MFIRLSPFRSSPPELFSKEDAPRHEANPQEYNNAEARSQQSRFATLLKLHALTNMPPKIRSTSAEHPPPGKHVWGTSSTYQENFKRLKLLKVFIYS